jgi:hypothetical protein
MCDYSLHGFSNRLAVEGEQLLLHRFPTGTLGLASPSDLWTPTEPPDQTRRGWWSRVKCWLSLSGKKSIPAVCIPPGAQLVLRDIPQRLQQQLGVSDEEEVTFVQLSADAYSYRDAVRFNNGREALLQKLAEGQRVDVMCLAPVKVAPLQVWPAAVTRQLRGA